MGPKYSVSCSRNACKISGVGRINRVAGFCLFNSCKYIRTSVVHVQFIDCGRQVGFNWQSIGMVFDYNLSHSNSRLGKSLQV
jgi:hypothetical protein